MTDERQEEFPLDTFRYLESLLHGVRQQAMGLAAEIAAGEDPLLPVYIVTRQHVDQAWIYVLKAYVALR